MIIESGRRWKSLGNGSSKLVLPYIVSEKSITNIERKIVFSFQYDIIFEKLNEFIIFVCYTD